MSRFFLSAGVLTCLTLLAVPGAHARQADPVFGELRLIDEIIPGEGETQHRFAESESGISEIRDILGRPTRVIPNTGDQARFIAYRLGEGKGLKANHAYVLEVDYPEDVARTIMIHNRGAETSRGVHTGATVGDVLEGRYVDSNNESLQYPLSGKHERFQMLFYLQERFVTLKHPRGKEHPYTRDLTPDDGIPVVISQWKARNAPLSEGAAISRIALYEVVDPQALKLEINYPPADLPRRHLFWREEMSDGVVGDDPGFADPVDWYRAKAEVMEFLGMNTYTIDMLEFGHNQGWDSGPGGGNDWVYQNRHPDKWERVLRMLKAGGYDFTMLPYYEYAGSVGAKSPGRQKLARPLGDIETYTHIGWSEKAYADITEPIILEDAKKVLDLTVNRWTDVMPFTGAWFRVRPSHIPVSFSDSALAKFSKQVLGGRKVTRQQLADRGKLYDRYIGWWNDQRKAFLVALADHLRAHGTDDAVILFTADASEPGVGLLMPGRQVVTDDVPRWTRLAKEKDLNIKPVPLRQVVSSDAHLRALLAPRPTWGKWEWDHAVPGADPANYKDADGVALTYSFNRLYTVSSSKAFDTFRSPAGLAIVRHYTLNENEMEGKLGYFVMDMERAGPYMMHAEVLAMAHGDPWHLGYLAGGVFTRGFPHYARRFNQAFLSLPALPSEVLAGASSDPEVIVRAITTQDHGTWLSIANTSMHPKPKVTIRLPTGGDLFDAATGEPLEYADRTLELAMDRAELRALHLR